MDITYDHQLNNKFYLTGSIIGYNKTSKKTIAEFNYNGQAGFGEVQNRALYNYSDFYFIKTPLELSCGVNKNNRFGLGAAYTRLLTTRVNVIKERNDFSKKEQTQIPSQFVYHYETFKLNNYSLIASY